MFSARVVEAVDVFEEGDLDLPTGLPVTPPDDFGLQGLEEAFDGGIEAPIFVKQALQAIEVGTAR